MKKFKFRHRTFLEHIIVIEIYILLTILAFHKIFVLGIDKWIIGDHGDAWHFIWNFWWVKKAILEGRNIFYTDYLFYPHGTHLYFHTLNLSGILLTLPLTFITNNLKLVYNISVLLTFILSGYFMYLLLNYLLSKNKKRIMQTTKIISFLGGCMYAFSPYVVSKALGYFNLLSIQWFPLALLLTFKLLEKISAKKIFLLSLLIITLFFADFHYFYYYFIFIFFFLLFNFKKIRFRNFYSFCFSIIFSLAIISLVYLPALFSYKTEKQQYVRDYFQTITVYNYFLPSPFTILYRIFPSNFLSLYYLSKNYMLVDSIVYYGIGYLVLLALLVIFLISKKRNLKDIYFLFVLFFFSSLMALGSSNPISLFLNNVLRRILPFFDLLPVPARHDFLAITSLVILFASLSKDFLIKVGKEVQYFFIVLLCLLFFMEYFPFYYDIYHDVEIPQTIYEMAQQRGFFTILNIPHKGNTQAMYLQTIHRKKILDGFVSRVDPNSTDTLESMRVLLGNNEKEKIEKILKVNRIRYIVVNRKYYPDYDYSFLKILQLLNTSLKFVEKTYIFEIYEYKT